MYKHPNEQQNRMIRNIQFIKNVTRIVFTVFLSCSLFYGTLEEIKKIMDQDKESWGLSQGEDGFFKRILEKDVRENFDFDCKLDIDQIVRIVEDTPFYVQRLLINSFGNWGKVFRYILGHHEYHGGKDDQQDLETHYNLYLKELNIEKYTANCRRYFCSAEHCSILALLPQGMVRVPNSKDGIVVPYNDNVHRVFVRLMNERILSSVSNKMVGHPYRSNIGSSEFEMMDGADIIAVVMAFQDIERFVFYKTRKYNKIPMGSWLREIKGILKCKDKKNFLKEDFTFNKLDLLAEKIGGLHLPAFPTATYQIPGHNEVLKILSKIEDLNEFVLYDPYGRGDKLYSRKILDFILAGFKEESRRGYILAAAENLEAEGLDPALAKNLDRSMRCISSIRIPINPFADGINCVKRLFSSSSSETEAYATEASLTPTSVAVMTPVTTPTSSQALESPFPRSISITTQTESSLLLPS